MSMSDTAEYWFNSRSGLGLGNMFTHAKDIECGHNHNTMDTIYIDDITCNSCKKIVSESTLDSFKEGKAPETYYMSHKEKKQYNAQKRFIEQYGKCPCGCNWQIRKNSKTNEEFLGCINYPKCKNTKSIKDGANH